MRRMIVLKAHSEFFEPSGLASCTSCCAAQRLTIRRMPQLPHITAL
jgi:hypothetical protein